SLERFAAPGSSDGAIHGLAANAIADFYFMVKHAAEKAIEKNDVAARIAAQIKHKGFMTANFIQHPVRHVRVKGKIRQLIEDSLFTVFDCARLMTRDGVEDLFLPMPRFHYLGS